MHLMMELSCGLRSSPKENCRSRDHRNANARPVRRWKFRRFPNDVQRPAVPRNSTPCADRIESPPRTPFGHQDAGSSTRFPDPPRFRRRRRRRTPRTLSPPGEKQLEVVGRELKCSRIGRNPGRLTGLAQSGEPSDQTIMDIAGSGPRLLAIGQTCVKCNSVCSSKPKPAQRSKPISAPCVS
jgi:hypothetical protein